MLGPGYVMYIICKYISSAHGQLFTFSLSRSLASTPTLTLTLCTLRHYISSISLGLRKTSSLPPVRVTHPILKSIAIIHISKLGMRGQGEWLPRIVAQAYNIWIVLYTTHALSRSWSNSTYKHKTLSREQQYYRIEYICMGFDGGGDRGGRCVVYIHIMRAYSTRIVYIPTKIFYYNNLHFVLCFANYICILKYLCVLLCF